ncbi:NAD(P)-dependent oxidoreductase [Christensenella tenuis]|uniref:Hydroxyacid dehydrogenase n=1 Tax=Christensenella tenuis TaxID=2763033 RepID=A0ABR7EI70_9FIRM|nr:NAD(P)-dependent oxidoreductase [Christensenella tenuis]MBC5649071.1 hydroxyacid dehydrogenase [Christensenella tenuis]
MKFVAIEPLGIKEESLREMAARALPKDAEIVLYRTRAADAEELIRRGRDADVIAAANQPLSAEVINGCENLKLLSIAFTGVDHIALDACRSKGITVCNSAGYSTAAVADLVFGMLISLERKLAECGEAVRAGKTREGLVGSELEGKRFGVVGTGEIGLRVARIAGAFGCEVLAYSRTEKDVPGIRYTGLPELLSVCDIVSLHVPLTGQTRGMIGEKELGLMKREAVLVNTARGPLVDGRALAQALREGRIGGAAVDVFDAEPPLSEDEPLLYAPRTVLAPHVGFATKEALYKRALIVTDNVRKWLAGTPQNVVQR